MMDKSQMDAQIDAQKKFMEEWLRLRKIENREAKINQILDKDNQ